jgi:hypothetical protein
MEEYKNETGEYIEAYDKCATFGTYEALQTGAPGAKVKK